MTCLMSEGRERNSVRHGRFGVDQILRYEANGNDAVCVDYCSPTLEQLLAADRAVMSMRNAGLIFPPPFSVSLLMRRGVEQKAEISS